MDSQTKIGIGAAAGIALMALLEPHLIHSHAAVALIIYLVLSALTVWGFTPLIQDIARRLRGTIVGTWGPWLLIFGGPIVGLIWLYLSHHEREAPEAIKGNIFISCQMTFLPGVMPPNGRFEVIFLSPETLASAGGKVPVREMTGPPGSKIDWPKSMLGSVPSGWRCEITNDTANPLLEVVVPLRIKFGKQGEEHSGDYDLVSIRLDPGANNRRAIYIFNQSTEGGSLLVSIAATAYQLGDSVRRPVRVAQPINELNQIVFLMPFFPATDSNVKNDNRTITNDDGQGGKGGDAKVRGSGNAVGGDGGQGGRYGRGGDGGSAEVSGDGNAAGGQGGPAGDDGIWRHPAKSGYEVYQRKMGLPVDPAMRQYGRGGTGPGYETKLQIIEQLRVAFLKQHSKPYQTIFENINAVPLEYLNGALEEMNEPWRVRIVDGDEYEFFLPGH